VQKNVINYNIQLQKDKLTQTLKTQFD